MSDSDYDIIKYSEDKMFFDMKFPRTIRKREFENLQLTKVGKYSISHPRVANEIVEGIKRELNIEDLSDLVITDATGGVGGDVIRFAKSFKFVNVTELNETHCDIIKNNVAQYKLIHKVKLYCGDFHEFKENIKQDIIYFDPPWGGPDFKKKNYVELFLGPINIVDLANEYVDKVKLVVIKVPPNYLLEDLQKRTKFKKMFVKKIKRKRDGVVKVVIIYLSNPT